MESHIHVEFLALQQALFPYWSLVSQIMMELGEMKVLVIIIMVCQCYLNCYMFGDI